MTYKSLHIRDQQSSGLSIPGCHCLLYVVRINLKESRVGRNYRGQGRREAR